MMMDLDMGPPWSNNAARRLGEALRAGVAPPGNGPSYASVMRWYADLAWEVHERIDNTDWPIRSKLLATSEVRIATDLLVGSRPKTQNTLVENLRRDPALQLDSIQDLAGVRVDADVYLGEQTQLAREIAEYFGADGSAIHDLRDGAHAGYRGVHVWLRLPAGRVEVQVRTILQSIWANVYERLADDLGRGIRYGEPAVPPPSYDQKQVDAAVLKVQGMSELIAAREADWQRYVEIQHASAIRANAVQKAMMVRSFVVGIRKRGHVVEPEDGGG